jgi:hypothetical protein
VRAAERQVRRIEAELDGRARPRRAASKPAAPAPPKPLTPLQAAIKEVQQQKQKQKGRKPGAKKTHGMAKSKASTTRRAPAKRASARRPPAKPTRERAIRAVGKLIRDQAILTAITPERATPGAPTAPFAKPLNPRTRAARQARKGVYGAVLQRTCECAGTGRIFTYDERTGLLKGSRSCPQHGRQARGRRRLFARNAAVDAGLPGLVGFLSGKRDRASSRLDKHQERTARRARLDPRRMGPTEQCPEAYCSNGVWDRPKTDAERAAFTAELVAACDAADRRPPSRRKLRAIAARALPYDHCATCGGVGLVAASNQVRSDGSTPVAEWRAAADLRNGHRPTDRERTTGRRMTENAVRAERARRLPRL